MMSELKKIYVAVGPGDAYVLRGLLEAEGISAIVRGDDMVPFQGGSLFEIETRPSVWVLGNDRELYARALTIAADYTASKSTDARHVVSRSRHNLHCAGIAAQLGIDAYSSIDIVMPVASVRR